MPRICIAIVALGLVAAASPAVAQTSLDKTLPAQLFEPAIGPSPFFTVESAEVPAHRLLGLSLLLNFQSKPFRVARVSGDTIQEDQWAVERQLSADLVGAVGLLGRFQVGAALPISLAMSGNGVGAGLDGLPETSSLSGAGIGDLRTEFKAVLWRRVTETQTVAIAAAPVLTIPLAPSGYAESGNGAADRDFLGERYPTFRPRVNADFSQGPIRAGANFGVIFRASSNYLGQDLSHQMIYGAGVGYDLGTKTKVRPVIELYGRKGFDTYQDTSPLEVAGGVKVTIAHMWEVIAGGGTGIIGGIGAPQWRGFVGVAFNPDYRDSDGDGIPNLYDDCPDKAEDKDGYKDADGCPEADNDGDGVTDENDRCPNEVEDFDTFQDADGCPEADNDHDGVPDVRDGCPFEPEDGKEPAPDEGCPLDKTDQDGDGVKDHLDKCPQEAEDVDGFKDDDGCADPDNDEDGVPDQFDACPNDAEDVDQFEDDDGCPDLDNDMDGVPDKVDRCPNEAETINGIKDEDGCPDRGAPTVVLDDKAGMITFAQRIRFREKPGEVTIRPKSEPILMQLVQLLKGRTDFAKVKVLSHGGARDSMEVMARRAAAVRMFIIDKGIPADRVVAALGKSGGKRYRMEVQIVERKAKKKGPAIQIEPAADEENPTE